MLINFVDATNDANHYTKLPLYDTYGVTTGMGTAICGSTTGICPYNYLGINFVFVWLHVLSEDRQTELSRTPLMGF